MEIIVLNPWVDVTTLYGCEPEAVEMTEGQQQK